MIELKEYKLEEIKKVLGISKRQWDERRQEILQYWKLFFDYEIKMQGRSYIFVIKEQYMEYEPLPRKHDAKEIQAFYATNTDKILSVKPRNTGANVAREIEAKGNKYHHATGTIANYVRPHIKENYYVDDKQWCEIKYDTYSYEPISAEQLDYLQQQFTTYLNSCEVADLISDMEAGYITKDEMTNCLSANYLMALNNFQTKYGFRPYKAGELKHRAWAIENEEA